MNKILPLDDSEIFIIFIKRYFDHVLNEIGYKRTSSNQGSCEVVEYQSKELKQNIKFIYDFLRSEKPYYQVYLIIEREGFLKKSQTIEVLDYFDNREEPTSIEATLALIREFFSRYLMPVLKGGKWIDEL